MVLDYRPPRKEEIQYVSDLVHGRHHKDAVALVAAAAVGMLFGLAVVTSSIASGNRNVDLVFIVACVAVCTAAVAVIVGLIMVSVRTIVAVCRVWKPARAITGIAVAYAVLRLARRIPIWLIIPSQIIMDVVLGFVMGTLTLLLFTILLRFIFFIRCNIKGVDDEELVAANISATSRGRQDGDAVDDATWNDREGSDTAAGHRP